MHDLEIRLIPAEKLHEIIPLVRELNPDLEEGILAERLDDMRSQRYLCAGAYHGESLVGICGLWVTTRFYCGKQVELDNVIVSAPYRAHGVGRRLMRWVTDFARSAGCRTCELNCYVGSARSHKFYFAEGFGILGFHFQKRIAE